jgi:hypothetical protein
MKTKLLKKVRRRFRILFYKEGATINGTHLEGQIAVLYEFNNFSSSLEDTTYVYEILKKDEKSPNTFVTTMIALTKEEAINSLRKLIIQKLRREHPNLGSYKKKTITRYF